MSVDKRWVDNWEFIIIINKMILNKEDGDGSLL